MTRKHIITYLPHCLLIIFALITASPCLAKYELPSEYRRELNDAIKNAAQYRDAKKAHIDSLRREFNSLKSKGPAAQIQMALKISDSYRPMLPDSALLYAQQAIDLASIANDETLKLKGEFARASALATAGLFVPALDLFSTVSPKADTEPLKIECWRTGRIIYSYMMTYTSGEHHYHSQYESRYLSYDDSLLNVLPRDDNFYQFIRGERLIKDRNYGEAKKILAYLLESVPDGNNLHGMAAFQMAEIYKAENEQVLYATFLCRAATSDIKCCVREGMALPKLARWLYQQGNLDDAFTYINFALNDATAANTRMQAVAITPMMPIIDGAYREQINKTKKALTWSLVCTSILIIGLAAMLFLVLRQRKRRHATHRHLAALSQRQDAYIGNFLGLCSSYAAKLDTLSKVVERKISAGQTADLLKMIKAGKFAEQNDDFYRMVDHAFLDMYPDFIFEVNKLLREDAQIPAREGHTLTPELRIYAFVRLGVEESLKISQILHYSVTTVYAYRNRMRNRAIDRANFDSDIIKLGRNI